jgi:DNA repair exonuclease SbcCD ATPase subunit
VATGKRPPKSTTSTKPGPTPQARHVGGGHGHELIDDLEKVLSRLAEASERLRQRLDQVDQYEQPARWGAINDQIRGLDERISALRDEHQRLQLAHTELAPIALKDLEALRQAIANLADIVRAAGTAAAVAEAAGKLAVVASELAKKSLSGA